MMTAERFNKNHGAAGSGHGGQFVSAGSGGGKKPDAHQQHVAHEQHLAKAEHDRHEAHLAHLNHLAAHPVQQGERGKRVSDLQARLNALGLKPKLKTDGVFGPKTLAAVKAFQKAHGLTADGLAGPVTMAALSAPAKAARKTAHKAVKRTALTGEASTVHEPIGSPTGPGLFHHKGLQLPAYVQHVAHHLMAGGADESKAIGEAVGIVKNWAAGHDGHGNKVHSDVQAAAAKAVAQWEADKAKGSSKARRAMAADGLYGAKQVNLDEGYDDDYDPADYDADGLNSTWDGDHSDLPDLGGIGVDEMEQAVKDMPGWGGRVHGQHQTLRAGTPKLGSGARFAKLKSSLAAKGASDPGALAAWIGRRKFGKAKFTKLAAHARGSSPAASRSGSWRDWEPRAFPLEDVHILTRSEGDGSGRVVEAYATVFDVPAEIRDGQGHYMEVIDRSAFDQTLARMQRQPGGVSRAVKVLYNHGKTAEGAPAPEFQIPIGVPLEIRPESRGLLTRTEYDANDPFTERILSKIRAGAITAQSFVGSIMRSDPDLRGPGDRYRARGGSIPTVRRMALGLREYGPVLWPAYSGAEILGVRMSIPGFPQEEEPENPESAEYVFDQEEDVAGSVPEDTTSARYHKHALYALRSRELREAAGIDW
jgi:HK97 family phage prohead protease